MPEYWTARNRTKTPHDSYCLRKMRWNTNTDMRLNREPEIANDANRTIIPVSTGGPKREIICGSIGIVSGIGGGPNNQPPN
jgi:hypothetical protein